MNDIQFVYFDVGGVLELDYSGTNKWIEMRRDLGVTEDLDRVFDTVWKKYRSKICIDCDVDNIVPEFEKATGLLFPKNYSMLADFVNRFEKNPSIWPIAKKAKEKYKVGLLTNMYPHMLSAINQKKLIPKIKWDAVVDSSVVGFQKPDDGIYRIAESMARQNENNIFFVDNSIEHVKAAQKRGWKTMLYNSQNPEESSAKLKNILEL